MPTNTSYPVSPDVIDAPQSLVERKAQDGLMVGNVELVDDRVAIRSFLKSYQMHSAHTMRAYQKEVTRFYLWVFCQHSRFPDVSSEMVSDYLSFLRAPQPFDPALLKAFGYKRQPFKGALDTVSIKHAVTILFQFYESMRNLRTEQDLPYCRFNPFLQAKKMPATASQGRDHALTEEELAAVNEVVEQLRTDPKLHRHYPRTRWIFQLLYNGFLRRFEASGLMMSDFIKERDGWRIRVHGKGGKEVKIVATDTLMSELAAYRRSLGLTPYPAPTDHYPAILPLNPAGRKGFTQLSDQMIYAICTSMFKRAAALMRQQGLIQEALRLEEASPHWMRHTGITHSLEAGVMPRYVQAQARHASLNTTSLYDHQEERAWRAAFEANFSGSKASHPETGAAAKPAAD